MTTPNQHLRPTHSLQATRRQVLAGAAGLGVVAALGQQATSAHAALLLDPDPVESYEIAWDRIDTSVTHNEAGGLAWGMSYILLSLLRMYQATEDTTYLDRFVERADQVWQQTDAARGVKDWRGRSGQVWRSGGNYTAAGIELTDADGTPIVDIRYATAAPTSGTVTVTTTEDGLVDVVLEHPTTGVLEFTGASLDPASPDSLVDKVLAAYGGQRWTAKWLSGAGPEAELVDGTSQLVQRWYVFPVHTGMITYPIAVFARTVLEHGPAKYQRYARRYLTLLRKSIGHHHDEWRWSELDNGERGGDYFWPKGAPLSWDGLLQPFNQTQGLGMTMAELHRISPEPGYAAQVSAMVASFLSDMETDGDAWIWRYWPTYTELFQGYTAEDQLSEYTPSYPNGAKQYEDISHAALSIEFMVVAHRAGLGGEPEHLERLVATYLDKVADGADKVFTRVDGTTPAVDSNAAQAGRWLGLAPWGPDLAPHVTAVYEAMELEPGSGSHLSGIAYVAWALNQGWDLG